MIACLRFPTTTPLQQFVCEYTSLTYINTILLLSLPPFPDKEIYYYTIVSRLLSYTHLYMLVKKQCSAFSWSYYYFIFKCKKWLLCYPTVPKRERDVERTSFSCWCFLENSLFFCFSSDKTLPLFGGYCWGWNPWPCLCILRGSVPLSYTPDHRQTCYFLTFILLRTQLLDTK